MLCNDISCAFFCIYSFNLIYLSSVLKVLSIENNVFAGYGNMAPRTKEGRLALVIYALFGIPLTMVVLGYMGQLLTRLSTKVNRLKLCSRKPVLNKVLNMVLIVCLGLTMLFLVPAFIFQQVEKWHYLDGLYYCFVTLSTIGFGDYVAGKCLFSNYIQNRLS